MTQDIFIWTENIVRRFCFGRRTFGAACICFDGRETRVVFSSSPLLLGRLWLQAVSASVNAKEPLDAPVAVRRRAVQSLRRRQAAKR